MISFHWSWLIDISFFPLYRVVQRVSECQNQTTRLDRDHLICLWVRETSHQASRGCHLKTGEQGLDRTLLPVAGEIDSWELQWFREKQVVFYLFTWLPSVLFFAYIAWTDLKESCLVVFLLVSTLDCGSSGLGLSSGCCVPGQHSFLWHLGGCVAVRGNKYLFKGKRYYFTGVIQTP